MNHTVLPEKRLFEIYNAVKSLYVIGTSRARYPLAVLAGIAMRAD